MMSVVEPRPTANSNLPCASADTPRLVSAWITCAYGSTSRVSVSRTMPRTVAVCARAFPGRREMPSRTRMHTVVSLMVSRYAHHV